MQAWSKRPGETNKKKKKDKNNETSDDYQLQFMGKACN